MDQNLAALGHRLVNELERGGKVVLDVVLAVGPGQVLVLDAMSKNTAAEVCCCSAFVGVILDLLLTVPSDLEGNIQDRGDAKFGEGGQIRSIVLGAKVEMREDTHGLSGVGRSHTALETVV